LAYEASLEGSRLNLYWKDLKYDLDNKN
jgi:hypothetical protein